MKKIKDLDSYLAKRRAAKESEMQFAKAHTEEFNLIRQYIDMKCPADWDRLHLSAKRAYFQEPDYAIIYGEMQQRKVSVIDIWTVAFGRTEKTAQAYNVRFIRDFMEAQPNWEARVVYINGKTYRGYVRTK